MKPYVLKASLTLVLMGLLVVTLVVPTLAQNSPAQITIRVDGLSCPFCAFGLEKKLRKLDGVQTVTIKVDQGVAELIFAPGATIDQNKIREAVEAGGFTPRKITVSQSGQ